MKVYRKLIRVCLKGNKYSRRKPITDWYREEYESFLLNEVQEYHSSDDLVVESKFVKAGEVAWH